MRWTVSQSHFLLSLSRLSQFLTSSSTTFHRVRIWGTGINPRSLFFGTRAYCTPRDAGVIEELFHRLQQWLPFVMRCRESLRLTRNNFVNSWYWYHHLHSISLSRNTRTMRRKIGKNRIHNVIIPQLHWTTGSRDASIAEHIPHLCREDILSREARLD